MTQQLVWPLHMLMKFIDVPSGLTIIVAANWSEPYHGSVRPLGALLPFVAL